MYAWSRIVFILNYSGCWKIITIDKNKVHEILMVLEKYQVHAFCSVVFKQEKLRKVSCAMFRYVRKLHRIIASNVLWVHSVQNISIHDVSLWNRRSQLEFGMFYKDETIVFHKARLEQDCFVFCSHYNNKYLCRYWEDFRGLKRLKRLTHSFYTIRRENKNTNV